MFCCKEHNLNFATTWHQVDMSCNTRLAPNIIGTKTVSIGKARNAISNGNLQTHVPSSWCKNLCGPFLNPTVCAKVGLAFSYPLCHFSAKSHRLFSVSHGSIPTLVSCALITSSCAIAMSL